MKSKRTSSRKSRSPKMSVAHMKKLAHQYGVSVTGLKRSSIKAKLSRHGVTCKIKCRKSPKTSSRKSQSHKKRSMSRSRKACKRSQVRDPLTHRCRTRKSRAGRKRKSGSPRK